MSKLEKQKLRRDFIARRAGLDRADRADFGRRICGRLAVQPAYTSAKNIGMYWPLADEVDLRPLISDSLAAGRNIYLPRIISPEEGLEFAPFGGDTGELAAGPMGLNEPTAPAGRIEKIDLFIVPGLAFDRRRYRLGYGQGYYDRILGFAPQATFIGAAFEVCLAAELPFEPHDVPMDFVITETEIF